MFQEPPMYSLSYSLKLTQTSGSSVDFSRSIDFTLEHRGALKGFLYRDRLIRAIRIRMVSFSERERVIEKIRADGTKAN